MLFYNEKFYNELEDIIEDLDIDQQLEDYGDGITCLECRLESIEKISADWITSRMNEERFPENDDKTFEQITKALSLIDFNAVNEAMPKLWYPTKNKIHFSKQYLINAMS